MGSIRGLVHFIVILGSILSSLEGAEGGQQVTSKLITRSGLLERVIFGKDERQFGVRLTRSNGQIEWLEEPDHKFSSAVMVERRLISNFADTPTEAVYEIDELGQARLLGLSPRSYDKECAAVARIDVPTPLSEPELYTLEGLFCDSHNYPLTQSQNFLVLGKQNQNYAKCKEASGICEWLYRYSDELEAATQVSTLGFLWRARAELSFAGLQLSQDPIRARSMAFQSNVSVYNAENRTLSFGEGAYPDGLDGFVVVHEWTHSMIDDINRGMYGYEAATLHEAIADYWAAQTFSSACFAPFDAQEVADRKCVRDLENQLSFPKDMSGRDPHLDSQIVSGTLWELQKILPKGIVLEMIGESLIRLPKEADLQIFWKKMISCYRRLLKDRPLLADRTTEFYALLKSRGFL